MTDHPNHRKIGPRPAIADPDPTLHIRSIAPYGIRPTHQIAIAHKLPNEFFSIFH